MKSLNRGALDGWTMMLLEDMVHLKKISVPGMGYLFIGQRGPEIPEITQAITISHHNFILRSYC